MSALVFFLSPRTHTDAHGQIKEYVRGCLCGSVAVFMERRMALQLSKRHEWVLQSEIRNMSIECDLMGGINLSQGVCDT